ncbi:MAG TPA: RNA methyltransferase [Solirubrobacteraceae bacterium]|jgi:TrmH family RNA methyltransferase
MTQIESAQNPRLKAIKRLQSKRDRAREGLFAVEGEDLLAAATRAGSRAVEGFRVTGSGLGGEEFVDVEQRALAAVSTLGSGTRAIGVYEQRWAERPSGPLCVYLHGVGDPGNVGTVLRSASAFGASGVALGPGCADPYGPKAVRASMGAIFEVEIARVESVAQLPGERVALVAGGGEPLRKLDGPVTLLIGAEREGLPSEVVGACERTAHIPIEAESLNAAMAATVALYEMSRHANRVAAK